MNEQSQTYRTGYVAVVGRPNVGKSTLVNRLLGQKIAAVSPRPQTTRRRQLGILTNEQAQIIFMDTPGLHQPHHKLGEYMNAVAVRALDGADVILWLVDAGDLPTEEDYLIAARLAKVKSWLPVLLGINKIDRLAPEQVQERLQVYQKLLPKAEPHLFSAATGEGEQDLLSALVRRLPEGAALFAEDQVTDLFEREIAVDLIREAALQHLQAEVPHCVAVRLDEFSERPDGLAYIAATLLVERDSQKGIVVGKGGEMIKKISSAARLSIEAMSDRRVYLELRVKVQSNWRNSLEALKWLGYFEEK